jgi:hypothetical protein
MQDLEGDRSLVLQVVGEVDRGHPAPAKLALNPIPTLEFPDQRRRGFGHKVQ